MNHKVRFFQVLLFQNSFARLTCTAPAIYSHEELFICVPFPPAPLPSGYILRFREGDTEKRKKREKELTSVLLKSNERGWKIEIRDGMEEGPGGPLVFVCVKLAA